MGADRSAAEFEAVKAVLLRHLEETEDEELQAAIWQLMDIHDDTARRLNNLKAAVVRMIGAARE